MIETGEYARTERGEILKITGIAFDIDGYKIYETDRNYTIAEIEIKTHSKNVEDLFEVGDIVMMCNIFGFNQLEYTNNKSELVDLILDIKDGSGVVGILTHELYNEDCYKINLRYENLKARELKEKKNNEKF